MTYLADLSRLSCSSGVLNRLAKRRKASERTSPLAVFEAALCHRVQILRAGCR